MSEPKEPCSVEGCEKPRKRDRRLCSMHAARLRRHGDVSVTHPNKGKRSLETAPSRFFSKVQFAESSHSGTRCLVWTAFLKMGYGQFQLAPGKPIGAHRWLYERWVGPIPDGYDIDHLCRNPSCVNPAHLEAVTHAENIRRGAWVALHPARTKTHCDRGHEYPPERGRCKQCQRAHQRAWRERQKENRHAAA